MQKHDNDSYHIYGMGAALADIEIDVDSAFLAEYGVEKGVMTLIDLERHNQLMTALAGRPVHRACGGSGANTILAANRFGSKTFYSCRIADDDYGQFYLKSMLEAGVQVNDQPYQADEITGKCLVMITPDAERSMTTFLGVNEALTCADLDEAAIKNSEYLYIEGYLVSCKKRLAAVLHAKAFAKQHGVKTCLSLSDPTIVSIFREGMTEIIGDGIDLLFSNEDEAMTWACTDDLDEAVAALQEIAKTFVITRGARGALLFDGKELINIAAYPAKALNTNGAGDMFAGAFLHGIIAGYGFRVAGDLACAAAAEVVSNHGPQLTEAKQQEILAKILGQHSNVHVLQKAPECFEDHLLSASNIG